MFEIPKNEILSFLLISFSIFTFIYRYWDVFFKSYGEHGEVYFRWTLYLLGLVHSFIGILALIEYFLLRDSYNWFIGTIAFAIFVAGQLLRNWAISSLGPYHSPHIEIKPNHQLLQKSPYSYVRNPYYLGVILEVMTTPLILNAFLTFAFSAISYVPILLFRIFMEEKILREHFGMAYIEYERKTPWLIPRFRKAAQR